MSARTSLILVQGAALAAGLCATPAAQAGHEVPYYPSFYPQEIRIERLNPDAAGRHFANAQDPLHAYIGAAPRFAGDAPANLKSVVSLRSLIVATANPSRLQTREARCRATAGAAAALAPNADLVAHSYPITPYHADYIGHVDRVTETKSAQTGPQPIFRAAADGSTALIGSQAATHPTDWDVGVDAVAVDQVLRMTARPAAWPAAPRGKDGWFQAYHLLRPGLSNPDDGRQADELYERLTGGGDRDPLTGVVLERDLLAALTRNCDSLVVGYRLRREFYNDDFSNGIENIAFDAQSGFNSPIFLRTVKLKDFPWNGWLRVGIDTPATATAAWNPVAGFTDAAGWLVWSTVGDNAFLPIPHNSEWVFNRTEIRPNDEAKPGQSIRIPADALAPEPGTSRIVQVGAGKGAMAKVTYRISASAFHDGTEMQTADFVYPYALAQRWGGGEPGSATFDPEISAATRLLRERFKGVRVVRVEETKLPIADLVFDYRWPIVEVYLDNVSRDEQENALLAPPWSSVPWHVLALMEAAVERGMAAFSRSEAERRRLPWLDLARDPAQLQTLRALIKEFARTGYRPAAIEAVVDADTAKTRWEALDRFVEASGHLLVTNGPYKLKTFTPEVYTFDVIREFTYPIGLGTFDFHAYPPKALITRVERIGNRVLLTADVEIALKQQRDRRVVRVPLKRDTLRETLPIRPLSRYIVVGQGGTLAAAGHASREQDGRFAASLPALPPGNYTFFGAILLDGNAIDPSIGRMEFSVN